MTSEKVAGRHFRTRTWNRWSAIAGLAVPGENRAAEKARLPAALEHDRLPLLPSGPGGVQRMPAAQGLAVTTARIEVETGELTIQTGLSQPTRHQSCEETGGADRARTDDLIRARDALSQTELLPRVPRIVCRQGIRNIKLLNALRNQRPAQPARGALSPSGTASISADWPKPAPL